MRKIAKMMEGLDGRVVSRAILHGARAGTVVGAVALSLSILRCLNVVFSALAHNDGVIAVWRAAFFIVQIALSLRYVNAYCKNDSSAGSKIIIDRSFDTSDYEVAKKLRRLARMAGVAFSLLGLTMAVFFAFWPALLMHFVSLVLLVCAMLVAFVAVRFCLKIIDNLYSEERRVMDEFDAARLDEDGDLVS